MSGEVEPGALVARMFLAGRARTKGHMIPNHVRGARGRPCSFGTAHDRPLLQVWMRKMARQIQEQLGIVLARHSGVTRRVDAEPYSWPVEVYAFFRFDQEESRAQAAEEGEIVPSQDTPWPTSIHIGDIDTLWRAVNDALVKSGVILDDRLIVCGAPHKRWTRPGEEAGVFVVVVAANEVEGVLALEAVAAEIR